MIFFGLTPLHVAARNGHLEVCKLIIANTEERNPIDNFGLTPKDYANKNKSYSEIMKILE